MKATGNTLKQRRESLKISIAEVSIATKITPRMIQAIEAGDMEMLPARTFLRGFVKSYATFLKMDLDAVLKGFAEEMAALEPPPPPAPGSEEASGKNSNTDYPAVPEAADSRATTAPLINDGMSLTKKTSLGLGLAALIAVIVFVYKMVDKYERESRVEQPPPTLTKIKNHQEKPGHEGEKPAKTGEPVKVEKVDVKEPVKAVEAKPEEAKPVAPPKPEPKPVEVAKPTAPAPKPAEPPKPAEVIKPPEPVKPAEAPPPPKASTQEIIIEALDKVELTFRVSGGQEKKVILLPDQYHTIKATGAVVLDLSDGGAVNIIHNGRDMGVPGDLGRPKKLQLP